MALYEEDLGGEVVGIAVEPYAAGMGALGVTLTRAVLVDKEVKVVDLTLPIVKRSGAGIILQKRAAHDYLVEEIP